MKSETMKMLEEWRKEILQPMDGITITKDYQPCENQTINLIWYVHKNVNGKEKVFPHEIKDLADDVTALNIHIDNVEKNELKKMID